MLTLGLLVDEVTPLDPAIGPGLEPGRLREGLGAFDGEAVVGEDQDEVRARSPRGSVKRAILSARSGGFVADELPA